ncbi:MAG TPA: hypothetical protein VMU50_17280 [Polyangia bacterium]|jgi:hypothetical protein|nr:hypothetical protein [Polyangia bacterium]
MTEATESTRLFELELLGGAWERRYRAARPEVEAMPWGTLDLGAYSDEELGAARSAWTSAAFQEHRTAAACASTLRSLVEACAPLDLVAAFSRFPLDEIVHVELCARMAMALGGGSELRYADSAICADVDPALPPLLRAAELVTRNFCVGEALSIPLLHGAWLRATHPLAHAVLGRIVRDEAAHGVVGWSFLDWALPRLDADGIAFVRRTAEAAIGEIRRLWEQLARRPRSPASDGHPLGWLGSDAYQAIAGRSLRTRVVAAFAARGIDVSSAAGSRQP